MRKALFISWILFSLTEMHAQTESARMALVIGVKNYKHIAPLQNTLNDARDMAATLKSKNFQVVELYDPETKRQMQEAIVKYFELLRNNPSSAGMVFYSGHGMQVDGSNYLIPTNANPQIKADLEDQCLNMDYVMSAIEQAGNPLNIFILDACRNNPFRGFYRSGEQGLSMVSSPKGSYIVFATKPGSVASDGNSGNGLFTSKLLKYMNAEGLNIEQVFKRVAADVATESNDAQRPWIASDYTGDFYFTPGSGQPSLNELTFVPAVPRENNTTAIDNSRTLNLGYDEATPVILVGEQTWTSKNLNNDFFSNGVKIAEMKTEEEWKNASKSGIPAWCYFNNDPANGKLYGKLYNWFAVTDSRKLCPVGWHIPTDDDWNALAAAVGASSSSKLKSSSGWNQGRNGADSYGFGALPAAGRSFQGKFAVLSEQGNWWSSTEEGHNIHWAYYRNIHYKAPEIFKAQTAKGSGFSVRCVRD